MADPWLLNVMRLADRLKKTPDEIRAMSLDDYEAFAAFARIEAKAQERSQ